MAGDLEGLFPYIPSAGNPADQPSRVFEHERKHDPSAPAAERHRASQHTASEGLMSVAGSSGEHVNHNRSSISEKSELFRNRFGTISYSFIYVRVPLVALISATPSKLVLMITVIMRLGFVLTRLLTAAICWTCRLCINCLISFIVEE